MESSPFDELLTTNVPHILEKIFLSMSYKYFKSCQKVSKTWRRLLTSESFEKWAKVVFHWGIQRDQRSLWYAASAGDVERVKSLLSSGMLNPDKEYRSTPLCAAALDGHVEVMKILLEVGADPNQGDVSRQTSLYNAAYKGNINAVKLLLDAGADPNCGNSKLKKAVSGGNKGIVKLLLDRGAIPTKRLKYRA